MNLPDKRADLHIHTHFSDGTSSPKEVIEDAYSAALQCIAITDHDTIDGIEPTIQEGKKVGIEVISGIELSSSYEGKDVHMLGYLFDHHNSALREKLIDVQQGRAARMKKMIIKLQDLGITGIDFDEVDLLTESDSVGRPHLAQILVEKGHVKTVQEAFDKYLADTSPAFVSETKLSPFEAIQFILEAGGVPVLAHPLITGVDNLIPAFVEAGLKGIEVFYPNMPETMIDKYKKMALKYDLLLTGGSDAHGEVKKHTYVGKIKVPYRLVERLKECRDATKSR